LLRRLVAPKSDEVGRVASNRPEDGYPVQVICYLPSAILSRRSAAKMEAQRRRDASLFTFHASLIKENQTRSLIKRSYLSKTNLPESNKIKDNDNKINQDKTSF